MENCNPVKHRWSHQFNSKPPMRGEASANQISTDHLQFNVLMIGTIFAAVNKLAANSPHNRTFIATHQRNDQLQGNKRNHRRRIHCRHNDKAQNSKDYLARWVYTNRALDVRNISYSQLHSPHQCSILHRILSIHFIPWWHFPKLWLTRYFTRSISLSVLLACMSSSRGHDAMSQPSGSTFNMLRFIKALTSQWRHYEIS